MVDAKDSLEDLGAIQIIDSEDRGSLVLVHDESKASLLARVLLSRKIDVHHLAVLREDGDDVSLC